jgi:hypothetical protein
MIVFLPEYYKYYTYDSNSVRLRIRRKRLVEQRRAFADRLPLRAHFHVCRINVVSDKNEPSVCSVYVDIIGCSVCWRKDETNFQLQTGLTEQM